ncbi:hypothetical protein WA026_013129 [Henosepilachna vigintioctopunctata]|uniref:Uncharacterized protein n=1 Tax=Henosepilachna vigintioctopunctata TaxID=420089 RepID=A0AAW1ULZ4_9CUCU
MLGKLVVLNLLLGIVMAYPGFLHGSPFGYAISPAIAIPAAVSHQARVDVYSKPVVVAAPYALPAIGHVKPVAIAFGHGLHGW